MLIWRTPEVDGIAPGQPGYDRRAGFMAGLTASAHRPPRVQEEPIDEFVTPGLPPGAAGAPPYNDERA
jgi:hypothetical protein